MYITSIVLEVEKYKHRKHNEIRLSVYKLKWDAQSAAHSNKCFTGKRIRDDLVLSDATDDLEVERSITKTMKPLDEMELSWSEKQKDLKKKHLLKNYDKKL